MPEYRALHHLLPRHPNLVTLLGVCVDFPRDGADDAFTMLMPLHTGGALRDYVLKQRRLRPLSAAELFAFALPMAKAVAHLHAHAGSVKQIHKDIALRNFVLTADGEPILIDFGMSAYCESVSE